MRIQTKTWKSVAFTTGLALLVSGVQAETTELPELNVVDKVADDPFLAGFKAYAKELQQQGGQSSQAVQGYTLEVTKRVKESQLKKEAVQLEMRR